ncbi:MAG TPA: carboxypeptidase M32, partial [Gemmataceae bacterium]|nr:carboxypeptidase M32 [Gemmataceae bacterium]
MNHAEAYAELIRRVKECRLLSSCAEMLAWDERTYMPHHGSAHRAEQMALLARLAHEMITAPEIGQLLSQADGSGKTNLDTPQAANLREIRRSYDRLVKLPKELVEELARVTTRAQQVWQEARAADDFAAFQPWLEKIVKL